MGIKTKICAGLLALCMAFPASAGGYYSSNEDGYVQPPSHGSISITTEDVPLDRSNSTVTVDGQEIDVDLDSLFDGIFSLFGGTDALTPLGNITLIDDILQDETNHVESVENEQKSKQWATVHNLKQMAQTVGYLREHGLLDYDELVSKTAAATARFNELSDQIKDKEKHMAEVAVLKTHIVNYAKTRDVYAGYRKAGYSKKYLAEHEGDILLHKAAKKAFDELGVKKLSTVKSLQAEYARLLAEKKSAYAEYRTVRAEMKELLIHKANVEQILGKDVTHEEKKNVHNRG